MDYCFTITDIEEFNKLKVGDIQNLKIMNDDQSVVYVTFKCKITDLNSIAQLMWLTVLEEDD